MAFFLSMKKFAVTLTLDFIAAVILFVGTLHADELKNNGQPDQLESPSFESFMLNDESFAVIVGKAPVNAKVELIDGARKLGETTADDKGSFTLTLQKKLGKGQYHFVLRATDQSGKSFTSVETVTVIISHKVPDGMAAFMNDPAGASRFISNAPGIIEIGKKTHNNFDVTRITYKNSILTISGQAEKNMQIIATLGNMRLGSDKTDINGKFELSRFVSLFSGDHVFRIDLFNDGGENVGSLAIPFRIDERHHPVNQLYRDGKPVKTVIVEKGDSLSSIAEKAYGSSRYSEAIYSANSAILKNPDHITKGQELILPEIDNSQKSKAANAQTNLKEK